MAPRRQSNLDAAQTAAATQFNRQSDRYGRSHILADTSDVKEALKAVPAPHGARALDVATGGGHTALCLARRGWRVTAGDISQRMLDNAGTLLREEGFELETALFPAEKVPFADATFGLVAARVAPHHFSSPERFVAEAARVLAPGGHFLLIDGSVPDADPETEEWLHRVETWRDPSHGRFLSRASWEELVSRHGLHIVSSALFRKKQPDLHWYFETAATPAENRERVRAAVSEAPEGVRRALRLGVEEGKIVWWWPMLRLLARK
jgi:SAM-dependent methyltransferase